MAKKPKPRFNAVAYYADYKADLFAWLEPLFKLPLETCTAFRTTLDVTLPLVDRRSLGKMGATWYDKAEVVPRGFDYVIVSKVTADGTPYLQTRHAVNGSYGVLVNSDPDLAGESLTLQDREGLAWLAVLCTGNAINIGDTTPVNPGSPAMWAIGARVRHAMSPRDVELLDLVKSGLINYDYAERLLKAYGDYLDKAD